MTKIQHVKIPVTDLRRSVAWYSELLDLVPFREFVEQGELRGAALRSPEVGSGSTHRSGFSGWMRRRYARTSVCARPTEFTRGRDDYALDDS
jgi:catechol 2,3-dioxygenase-like lactoylglutathione lyase family enzyme